MQAKTEDFDHPFKLKDELYSIDKIPLSKSSPIIFKRSKPTYCIHSGYLLDENTEKKQSNGLEILSYGKRTSLYPIRQQDSRREGEPNADSFELMHFGNSALFAIADGCGWGIASARASQRAVISFVKHLLLQIENFHTIEDVAQNLQKALAFAHNSIIENPDDIFAHGTTTILGGALFPFSGSNDIVVFLNLGDCKLLRFSYREKKIYQLNEAEKGNSPGRIGPYLDDGKPDPKNLHYSWAKVEFGDFIIAVSDGFWKNFDSHFNSDLKVPLEEVMTQIIQPLADVNPVSLVDTMIDFIISKTEFSRQFLESNHRLPSDAKGRLDHTACFAFGIGKLRKISAILKIARILCQSKNFQRMGSEVIAIILSKVFNIPAEIVYPITQQAMDRTSLLQTSKEQLFSKLLTRKM